MARKAKAAAPKKPRKVRTVAPAPAAPGNTVSTQWPPAPNGTPVAPPAEMRPQWTAEVASAKLTEWYKLCERVKQEAAPLQEAEMKLRRELASYYKPDGHSEGTINIELGAGWKLKCVYALDRKYDEQAMESVFKQLSPDVQRSLIKWTPSVLVTGYRQLSQEQLAVVDQCVVSKPKAPTLELLPPTV